MKVYIYLKQNNHYQKLARIAKSEIGITGDIWKIFPSQYLVGIKKIHFTYPTDGNYHLSAILDDNTELKIFSDRASIKKEGGKAYKISKEEALKIFPAKVVFEKAKEKDEKECITESVINEKRKRECEAEIDTYTELASKAKVSAVVAQYEKKIERIAEELEKLSSNSAIQYDYAVPYRTALEKILGIPKDPYSVWNKLNVFEKQKFYNFLFEFNLLYDKKDGYRTPKYTVLKRVCGQIELVGSADVDTGHELWNQIESYILRSYQLIQDFGMLDFAKEMQGISTT